MSPAMPRSDDPGRVLTIILGGGAGTRLFPLTRERAKPAVPLAGKYRLVDIPISNSINSGMRRIYLLTQFLSASLHRHVYGSFKFDHFTRGFVEILAAERDSSAVRDPDLVLLLPGSRRGEVERLLPEMVRTAAELKKRHPQLRFVLPLPRPAVADMARECLARHGSVPGLELPMEVGRTHYWMQRAAAGIAASGTVTMEAAILGLPLVSVYRLAWPSYWLAKLIVRGLRFFTIVNLVAGREVFAEFVQSGVRAERLAPAVEAILPGGARRQEVERGMADAVAALGGAGSVSATAARLVLEAAEGQP